MPKPRISARILISLWKIPCDYGLYSQWGNFYGLPSRFPVALLDKDGYVIVKTKTDLETQGGRFGKRLNVPKRIKTLQGYIRANEVGADSLPEEIPENPKYWEGLSIKVSINRYERDSNARKACLAHYGYRCLSCGLLMEEKYGKMAEKLIHVHHIVPLANIAQGYAIDPIKDLRPVCPNCHLVIHRSDPPITMEELKKLIHISN